MGARDNSIALTPRPAPRPTPLAGGAPRARRATPAAARDERPSARRPSRREPTRRTAAPRGATSGRRKPARGATSGCRKPARGGTDGGGLRGLAERLPHPTLPTGPGARAALVALAVVAVLVAFLYAPVRERYVSWRVNQLYTEQLAQLDEQNEGLQAEVNRLQSREGVEDEARKRGYVSPGETAVTVEGLEGSGDGDASGGQDADAAAEQDGDAGQGSGGDAGAGDDQAVGQDRPWHIALLDFVFGYDPSTSHIS